jgi:hypothetical protein
LAVAGVLTAVMETHARWPAALPVLTAVMENAHLMAGRTARLDGRDGNRL